MKWQITWTSLALEDLRRYSRNAASRVVEGITHLVETGHGDVHHLHGVGDEWRLREGDYRARFSINRNTRIVTVLRVFRAT